MSLNQEAVKVAREANELIKNVNTQSQSVYSEIVGAGPKISSGGFFSSGASFNGESTVGIQIEQIPSMKKAITDYVDNLRNHLQEVKRNADTSQAFKGDYANAVREFVNAICNSCENIISNLNEFCNDLDKVQQAYLEKDESMSSDVKNVADQVDGAFTRHN